jgi:hypothetical protein
MENDYKIVALEKMFNKLVVPKVNSLEDRTGFTILDISVEGVDKLTSSLLVKPLYNVTITALSKKKFSTNYDAEDFYVSLGHLFLNAYEYIVPNGYLHLKYFDEEGNYLGDDEFETDITRYPDSKVIKQMLKTTEWEE